MIELACHIWAYNDRPLEEAVGTIARMGFRNIDLGSGAHLDLETAAAHPGTEARRLREVLRDFNLSLTDLYLNLPYINDPDPEKRAEQIDLFERLLPFALALGTPGITISPGILHDDGQEHSLARAIPSLLRLVQAAVDSDLRISFEPHMDSAVTTPADVLLLVEAVPGLSLTLDYAHFIVQGIQLKDIKPLLPHAAHVHIRQAVKGRLQTAFAQGRIDLKVMMQDLHEADFHGTVTVEYMTSTGWHGTMPVSIGLETVKTRDTLRELRASLPLHGNHPVGG